MSPETAKALLDAGYIVRVEESSDRIYKTDEFRAVGAEIVPAGSWVNAPLDNIILGLKEIDADGSALILSQCFWRALTNTSLSPITSYLHSLCPRLQEAARMGNRAIAIRKGWRLAIRPGVSN